MPGGQNCRKNLGVSKIKLPNDLEIIQLVKNLIIKTTVFIFRNNMFRLSVMSSSGNCRSVFFDNMPLYFECRINKDRNIDINSYLG